MVKSKKRTTKVNVSTAATSKAAKKKEKREIGLLGQALRHLGGMAGTAVGGMVGAPMAGGAAGSGLGAAISRWLGSGDYSVSQNSIVNSLKASGSIPMMHSENQSIIVRHKEFLTEVRSSVAFNVQRSFTINPGNRDTFPWLYRLANQYQQYRIKGMVFHYVPTSGSLSAGTSNALGSIMMQTSYRSNDTQPANKIELLNEYWSTESVPSECLAHPIECNPNENPFNVQYVRSSDSILPTGDSPLLYDLGTTHLAVSGQQADNIALGDLWVTYEVELKKPIISSNVTTLDLVSDYRNTASPTFADPFGVGTSVGTFRFTTTASREIVLPQTLHGSFYIMVVFQGASMVAPSITGAPTLTGLSLVNWNAIGTDRFETNAGGATPTVLYAVRVVKTTRDAVGIVQLPIAALGSGAISTVTATVIGVVPLV